MSTNDELQAKSIEEDATVAMPTMQDIDGTVVAGRYKIKHRIGKGGMGVVYLAQQTNLCRDVVIKILSPQLVDDEDALVRFEREARGLSKLQHPNIVTIYDFGRDKNLAYIAMEYAQGETLGKFLKHACPLDMDTFLPIAIQILKGIGEAHKLGLIHRDIKPANIILCELDGVKNFVKILDFGLAKLAQGQEDVTKEQQLVGSSSFMAPELIVSGKSDTRTDVYAIGILFFLMLSGKKPFAGNTDTVILYKHVNQEVPSLKALLKPEQNIPLEICNIVERSLSKDPNKRPQDANEYLNDFAAALNDPNLRTRNSITMASVQGSEKSSLQLNLTDATEDALTIANSRPSGILNVPPDVIAYTENRLHELTMVRPHMEFKKERKALIITISIAVTLLVAGLIATLTLIKDKNEQKPLITTSDGNIIKHKNRLSTVEAYVSEGKLKEARDYLNFDHFQNELQNYPELLKQAVSLKAKLDLIETLQKAQDEEATNPEEALRIYRFVLKQFDPNNAIAKSKIETLTAALQQPVSITLNALNEVTNATLFVDNESIGTVPGEIQLKPGDYSIKIQKEGYHDWTTKLSVKPQAPLSISFQLEKKPTKSVRPASPSNADDSGLLIPGKKNSGSQKKKGGLMGI